ncbi:MAG: type II pantothenate kinase [Clostridia bacterium]|nr:type II pantothenate kinase [Clostridia bacterium]
MKNVIIGIDVGGSTTKIVGFDVTNGNKTLIEPIFVKATDPVTSTFGAFGKFLDENDLSLSDIERVMITGAGSSFITKPLYGLPCYKIEEFMAIGLGGLYLSGLKKALIASLGTGTALVFAEEGQTPKHLGGTGVGGGTLVGLSKKLLDMDTVTHIEELAKDGSLDKVDLRIGDLINNNNIPGFTDTTTASNFGNISDLATKADIALGVINMVFETIGMISIFAARGCGIRDIILTGNLSSVVQAGDIFSTLNRMFDVNFIIPEYSRFGTVIGAALADCPVTSL